MNDETDAETLACIHRAIDRLDPFLRELLWMAAGERRSYDEIASHFGISSRSVERSLLKALGQIRRAMAQERSPRVRLCFWLSRR